MKEEEVLRMVNLDIQQEIAWKTCTVTICSSPQEIARETAPPYLIHGHKAKFLIGITIAVIQ